MNGVERVVDVLLPHAEVLPWGVGVVLFVIYD